MFGYVTPCKMELKMKDYEKFKAYYCGLCKSIKSNMGNIPRVSLNYDMTFLAILLDSLDNSHTNYYKETCMIHAFKKKIIVKDNDALAYAAFCNVILSYYKLLDNIKDDGSKKDRVFSLLFKGYLKKVPPNLKKQLHYIETLLDNLNKLELNSKEKSIDELADPFAELTALILSTYKNDENKDNLYWLGYNLGKWIYIIDALDDLETDMTNNKFNAINSCFNKDKLPYKDFYASIQDRIDFILGTCAAQCMQSFTKLEINKNRDLLYNILQFGLLEKMDKVFKRSVCDHEKSI
ncbi:DUF5685 family protein [Clostridium sp. DJ247]|uniref:DUF5685 family protein n=1 Tax=Clostridium sp. DJ247 TaxID=2726188 RepID=UPI0016292F5E|nr:DUF5685 family protein [Clostridium sp. DJ247]MBC2581545.1 hypothetical protein [Clostridium sp. DJ247]